MSLGAFFFFFFSLQPSHFTLDFLGLSILSNGFGVTQLRDYRTYYTSAWSVFWSLMCKFFVTAGVISVSWLKVGFILFVCFLGKICFICENVLCLVVVVVQI